MNVQIAADVALRETQALLGYYEQRVLILAQAIADLQAEIAGLTEKLAKLEPVEDEIVNEDPQ